MLCIAATKQGGTFLIAIDYFENVCAVFMLQRGFGSHSATLSSGWALVHDFVIF